MRIAGETAPERGSTRRVGVGLGNAVAIIDLSSAGVPADVCNGQGRGGFVFNGEHLQPGGEGDTAGGVNAGGDIVGRTDHSDTEVDTARVEEWASNAFARFSGS